MEEYHKIGKIKFHENTLHLEIDGQQYTFSLAEISKRLANASDQERNNYQISPSGYGIHWPLIDEDLSIDGLLQIAHSSTNNKQIVGVSK